MNRVLKKIISKLYMDYTVVVYKLKTLKFKENKKIVIKKVDSSNVGDILDMHDDSYLKKFKKFLLNGDEGYYAYINDKCIHRSWVKTNQIVNIHEYYKIKLNSNQIYIHYCETDFSARGNGVYPSVLSKICKDNLSKEVLIAVGEKNIPSIKGVKKVGFEECFRVKVFVLMGIKKITVIKNNKE